MVSERLQSSLLVLSTGRLIFFQNASDPYFFFFFQNARHFCLHLLNGEINLVSSEDTGGK